MLVRRRWVSCMTSCLRFAVCAPACRVTVVRWIDGGVRHPSSNGCSQHKESSLSSDVNVQEGCRRRVCARVGPTRVGSTQAETHAAGRAARVALQVKSQTGARAGRQRGRLLPEPATGLSSRAECGAAAAERGPRTSCGCVPRRRLRRGAYVTQEARVGSTQSVVAFHRSCRQDLEVSYQVWCAWWGQRGSIGLGRHTLAPPTPPWKPLVEAYSAALSHFRIYHPWSLSAPGGGARSNRMVPAASHPARALVRVRKHAWEPSERAGTSSAQGVKTSIFEPFSA